MIRVLIRAVLVLVMLIALAVAFLLGRGTLRRDAVENLHRNVATFKVTADGFDNGAMLPPELTCRGASHSPAVAWEGAPAATKSYALLLVDFDVPSPDFPLNDFTHWSVYNLPPKVTHVAASIDADALKNLHATQGRNSDSQNAYDAPCPPMGTHRYVLGVYALDINDLAPASDRPQDVLDALKGHVIGYGEVAGKAR